MSPKRFAVNGCVLILCLGATAQAEAGAALDQATNAAVLQQPRPDPDFLLQRPRGSVSLKGTWFLARADSDLLDFVQEQLTVDRRDFSAAGLATGFAIAITPWVDTELGVDFSRAFAASEYRRFLDENRRPITQETRLIDVDLTASVRVALLPRAQGVTRLVWVPHAVVPYLGAGAGYVWYQFRQTGDFVDFVDLSIFTTTFRSAKWTPSAHVLVGTDVRLHGRLFLEVEGRYRWARAEPGGDFVGFETIDLSGAKIAAGISYLF